MNTLCALCAAPCFSLSDSQNQEPLPFCCLGCKAVYQILGFRKTLEHPEKDPLYQKALASGLLSNSSSISEEKLLFKNRAPAGGDVHKLQLEIREMWCPSCALVIRLFLSQEQGVYSCLIDYCTDLASIEFDPVRISKEKILRVIAELGYVPGSLEDPAASQISTSLLMRFMIAAFFSSNSMMLAYPIYASRFDGDAENFPQLFAWLSFFCSIPVLLYSGWPIWQRFYQAIQVRVWGMESLIFLGVASAFCLSLWELFRGGAEVYFDSMTAIILFVLLGKMIESRAKFSVKASLIRLMHAVPQRGRKRLASGLEIVVPLKEIEVGDQIVVLAGEKIGCDGVVDEGEGSCEEALMTGESLPVVKQKGDAVLAGTFLLQGYLVIRVREKREKSTLARILQVIEEDIQAKAVSIGWADRIAAWFVPSVLVLAAMTVLVLFLMGLAGGGEGAIQTALIRGVSVLLIACPCALGIAAPLAESQVLQAMAKWGVLVRNRRVLDLLGLETLFVFDKTGTVTEGKFKLLRGAEKLSSEELSCLKGLCMRSHHPIASALTLLLEGPAVKLDQVEEVAGKGIRGMYQGKMFILGSKLFLEENGMQPALDPERAEAEPVTTSVFFAQNQTCLAELVLGDRIKPGVKELLVDLSIPSILISGDRVENVAHTAAVCGFKEWHGQCNPFKKRELIEELKSRGEIVAMVGDGINDTLALSRADISIGMASAAEVAIQVSDLILTHADMHSLASVRALAKRGRRILKQNLFWAFFYNILGIGLAMAGLLSPLFAAFAMIASSLMVLLNAKRI